MVLGAAELARLVDEAAPAVRHASLELPLGVPEVEPDGALTVRDRVRDQLRDHELEVREGGPAQKLAEAIAQRRAGDPAGRRRG